ncbi:MAG: nucleoside-diphosphate sugar epimerase/dehydratase [Bacteroidota bacterium]
MLGFVQSLRVLPRWIILLLDLLIFFVSITLAFIFRFNLQIEEIPGDRYTQTVSLYLFCNLVTIFLTRSYAGIIRYTGLQDGLRIFVSTSLGAGLAFIGGFLISRFVPDTIISMSALIISYFVSMLLLFAYRLGVKYVFSYYTDVTRKSTRALIFGAGRSGIITKGLIDTDNRSPVRVVGFLEDDPRKVGKHLSGVKIYHAKKDLVRVVEEEGVEEVIIAIQNFGQDRKNSFVDACLQLGIKVRQVPDANRWVKGEFTLNQIKEINIEDLLGRDTIRLETIQLNEQLHEKVVLITGAAGSIGSEIVRQVLRYSPATIILVDQAESALYDLQQDLFSLPKNSHLVPLVADVTNKLRMRQLFEKYRPNVVYHAAAYKHVPLMETYPTEAVLTNVLGTQNVADLSIKYHVEKFVLVSTDKAVNPTNVMGATKRIAEIYVQALNHYVHLTENSPTQFVTTRFGNVLGSNGSVIPLFKKQINRGGPVTVTHPDIERYFMTIPEACQLVLEAGAMGQGGEIYVFDMGKSIKIADLAKRMIQLSGLQVDKDIEIQYTGLREGEKLYEELLATEENTLRTHHPKIMIAKVKEYAFHAVQENIERLIELTLEADEMKLVSQMKSMVPEFVSNASRFEVLDKHRPKSSPAAN